MAKEKKFLQKFMIYFIAFIMITSVIGFLYGTDTGDGNTSVKEAGYKFVRKGAFWSTFIDKKEALFSRLPSEVSSIQMPADIAEKLKGTLEIDFTYDINDTNSREIAEAFYYFGKGLDFNFNKYARVGLLENSTFNMPIITCQDATAAVPVVLFRTGNETRIFAEGECIIAEGEQYSFSALKDRMLYGMFGILK